MDFYGFLCYHEGTKAREVSQFFTGRYDMYTYTTKGTCSRQILFDIVDGKVTNVQFVGGCHGNTQGVAALVEGMDAEEVIRRLDKIDCKGRGTSCPDQLARAIRQVLKRQAEATEA